MWLGLPNIKKPDTKEYNMITAFIFYKYMCKNEQNEPLVLDTKTMVTFRERRWSNDWEDMYE